MLLSKHNRSDIVYGSFPPVSEEIGYKKYITDLCAPLIKVAVLYPHISCFARHWIAKYEGKKICALLVFCPQGDQRMGSRLVI